MLKLGLLAVAASLFATGCVVRERVVYAEPSAPPPEVTVTEDQPPAPYVEVVPAPRPGWAWVPGAWVWRGHWVWVRGHWAHPPRAGAVWIEGHYEYRGGTRVYIGGYWR